MPLPDYDNPPVCEVVLGVQFEPLEGLRSAHIGLFWARVRGEFPKLEEHPELSPTEEHFGPPPSAPRFKLQVIQPMSVPRHWFLSADGTELIQLQQSRLFQNWRKIQGSDSYPRYENIRERFLSSMRLFRDFLAEEKLGDLVPTQCEITYVNKIFLPEGRNPHRQLDRILTLLSRDSASDSLGLSACEDMRFGLRYLIPDKDSQSDQPIGRLHVGVEPRWTVPDGQPLIQLTLTARGKPASDQEADILGFLDTGRESIVEGFTAITTPEMHDLWGRRA